MTLHAASEPGVRLEKPGAGIPLLERLVGRYWLLPRQSRAMTWESCIARYERESEKILRLLNTLSPSDLETRVLVPRFPGIEDSSRFWSPAMVVEHLLITGEGMARIALDLSHGRVPPIQVDTARVKPAGGVSGQEAARELTELASRVARRLRTEAGDRHSPTRHRHPWFGPITAHQWVCLIGLHQATHRKQLQMILARLPSGRA